MTGHRRRDEGGAAAIEFALVFCFVVLPFLFGIIQYGYHYWALSTADATAREAARALSVGTEWTCTQDRAEGLVGGPSVGEATPLVTMSYGADPVQVGTIVTVRVRFDSLHLGFLPLPDGGAVDRSAAARVENIPNAPLPC